MSNLPSAFKSRKGEAEYMAAYDATMRLWPVPYEARDIPSRPDGLSVQHCRSQLHLPGVCAGYDGPAE